MPFSQNAQQLLSNLKDIFDEATQEAKEGYVTKETISKVKQAYHDLKGLSNQEPNAFREAVEYANQHSNDHYVKNTCQKLLQENNIGSVVSSQGSEMVSSIENIGDSSDNASITNPYVNCGGLFGLGICGILLSPGTFGGTLFVAAGALFTFYRTGCYSRYYYAP